MIFVPCLPPPAGASFVVAFVLRDDRFLVCNVVGRGWCVPSGKVESDETPLVAVKRETLEETGLALDTFRPFGHFALPDGTYAQAYAARCAAEVPFTPTDEVSGTAWMSLVELPSVYFTWSPAIETAFRTAMRALL